MAAILIFSRTEGAGVGDYSSRGWGARKIEAFRIFRAHFAQTRADFFVSCRITTPTCFPTSSARGVLLTPDFCGILNKFSVETRYLPDDLKSTKQRRHVLEISGFLADGLTGFLGVEESVFTASIGKRWCFDHATFVYQMYICVFYLACFLSEAEFVN